MLTRRLAGYNNKVGALRPRKQTGLFILLSLLLPTLMQLTCIEYMLVILRTYF